ncbi:bem46 protein, variant [Metarhizium acridum]|nr:bem46 protein, variant [Metarhizium acridum]
MSSPNSAPASTLGGYLEQTASALSSVASYMRLPALASTGIAAALTSLLYFKQKYGDVVLFCFSLGAALVTGTWKCDGSVVLVVCPDHWMEEVGPVG